MKTRVLLTGMVAFCGMLMLTGRAVSQEEKQSPEDDEVNQAMMDAWKKVGAPSKFHEHLKPLVGNWDLALQWRMTPDQPWEESKSRSTYRWVMGGRFVIQDVEGDDMMGEKFEGMGVLAYDNVRKHFTSIWFDNMSTGFSVGTGQCDESGKVITFESEGAEPFTGKRYKERTVVRIISNNKHVWEMYMPGPDGKEFKSMEIVYTRR